jgi:hypothetical protein
LQWERIVSAALLSGECSSGELVKKKVVAVLRTGEVIMEYHEDKPFRSRLMLGFSGVRPLHVVAAPIPPPERVT